LEKLIHERLSVDPNICHGKASLKDFSLKIKQRSCLYGVYSELKSTRNREPLMTKVTSF